MSTTIRLLSALGLAAALAACGTTDVERAATGGVLGGAVAAATGEDIGEYALYGAAAGAVSCYVAPSAPNCY